MNSLKKYLGLVWIFLAMATVYFLVSTAVVSINPSSDKDINKPLPWIIIISIFIPIAIGLVLFGWYAYKGEYDNKQ